MKKVNEKTEEAECLNCGKLFTRLKTKRRRGRKIVLKNVRTCNCKTCSKKCSIAYNHKNLPQRNKIKKEKKNGF